DSCSTSSLATERTAGGRAGPFACRDPLGRYSVHLGQTSSLTIISWQVGGLSHGGLLFAIDHQAARVDDIYAGGVLAAQERQHFLRIRLFMEQYRQSFRMAVRTGVEDHERPLNRPIMPAGLGLRRTQEEALIVVAHAAQHGIGLGAEPAYGTLRF